MAVNDTIAYNTVASGGYGGGLDVPGGTATLDNTIVALNTHAGTPDDISLYGGGTVNTANGYNNLIGTGGSGGLINGVNGNQVGVSNPGLAPLADYGGATQTCALLPGSPAIDAGAASISGVTIPTTDQRGLGRVGNVDIGAFESQGFTLAVASGSTPQSAYVNATFANPLSVTVAANNPVEPVNGGVVTFLAPGSGPTATLSATTATIAAGAASVTATANGTAGGPYTVSASTAGAAAPASFVLTNQFPLSQTVRFGPLANQTYGVVPITLTATASSNLPVSYTVISGPATVSGDILTVTGAGLVDVEADQGGNATYAGGSSRGRIIHGQPSATDHHGQSRKQGLWRRRPNVDLPG